MTFMPHPLLVAAQPARWRTGFARHTVSAMAVLADATVIVVISLLMGAAYHLAVYGGPGPLASFIGVGITTAGLFVLPGIFRGEYELTHYLAFRPHLRRVFNYWNVTFVALLALAFLTRLMEDYSRGSMVLFYAAGLPALLVVRYALVRTIVLGSKVGLVTAQRAFLIGTGEDISGFVRRYQPWSFGLHMVGVAPLTRLESFASREERRQVLETDLRQAVESARNLRPDAVYIVTPWSETGTINTCVDEFLKMPVEIHLGPERILDRFEHVRIARHGPMASLQLTRAPLTWFERTQKRAYDVVIAAGALMALAPLFIVVGFAIWLESGHPVFFFQRRYGFNQQEFRIIKFRTMTTLDDGDVVRQATRNDRRVTRVGRFLRKWNIDELPQLINVLKGDMSLVGPRPHALSHNREYERKIALYARRHNVLPGITGWAQVNGFRGETDTDEKMRARVDHDLYYIDNWSPWFDLRILLKTLVSRGV
ncbi:MAG: exopolysaccharide biosynthesis polyprenyl glycosylphosphotransferase [Alphaproteobacteria bacterium]|nr:MAG: exopolysaccharide biosynthesis polyprenyl glycosylphosphotransferase [Alphaproteobacteria bacterium]